MPVPLRADFDAPHLRAFAKNSKDEPQARRLLALAAIYDGASRTQAAKIGSVTLQIVRDWALLRRSMIWWASFLGIPGTFCVTFLPTPYAECSRICKAMANID